MLSVISIKHRWDDQMTHLCLTAAQYFLNIGPGVVVISMLSMVILSFHKRFLH